jgi:hypothetical protein
MNITKEDILNGFQQQCKKFDKYEDDIDDRMRDKYPKLLKTYILVKPYEVTSILEVGDYIRYIRLRNTKPSCVCVIEAIEYTSKTKKTIDKIIVSSIKYGTKFKVYPSNQYIYRKDTTILDQIKIKKMKEYTENKRNVKFINLTHETRIKLNDQLLGEHDSKMDNQIDNIFKKNDEDKINRLDPKDSSYIDKLLESTKYRKSTMDKIKKIVKEKK